MIRRATFSLAILAAAASSNARDLLVTSLLTDEVLRYNATTGAYIGSLVSAGSGGLDGPQGIAVGSDGVLYIAGEYSGSIHKYNAATGAPLGVLASGLAAPNDLTFGPGGLLYYMDHGADRVRRFNTTLGTELAPIMLSDGSHHAHGITAGPDGMIYIGILDSGPGRVRKLNPTTLADLGDFVTIPGTVGIFDLAFLPDGSLAVNDSFAGAIYRYSGLTGAPLVPLAAPGTITSPFGMAMGPDGLLYVCSGGLGVQRYNPATLSSLGGFISGGAGSPFAPAWYPIPAPGAASIILLGAALGAKRRRAAPSRSC